MTYNEIPGVLKSPLRYCLKIVNTLLSPAGLRITGIHQEQTILLREYINIVKNLHECLSEIIFPQLPPCDGRIELMAKLIGTGISEAMYILNYLYKSLGVKGDVCEFGVAQGATSALLANEIRTTEKDIWLFDSFKGLPKPTDKDLLLDDIFNLGSIAKYEGKMAVQIGEVIYRLKNISYPFSRVKIVPGFIEETINYANLPNKVCFAYLDFDFYNPTSVALNFLGKHLSIDGFIVVDDYNFFSAGVKAAVDKFIEEHPDDYEMILPYNFAGHFCILHKKQ